MAFAMGIVENRARHPLRQHGPTRPPCSASTCADGPPTQPVTPIRILTFDQPAALNGACLMAPHVILLADSLAGLIWRVDLADNGLTATASVWLQHPTMAPDPDSGLTSPIGPQPGINGIRYAPRTNAVYYTSTAQRLFHARGR